MVVGRKRYALVALPYIVQGDCIGPRAGLDGCGKSRSPPKPRFDPMTNQPAVSSYTDCPIPVVAYILL
jgi:hypothetical protein